MLVLSDEALRFRFGHNALACYERRGVVAEEPTMVREKKRNGKA